VREEEKDVAPSFPMSVDPCVGANEIRLRSDVDSAPVEVRRQRYVRMAQSELCCSRPVAFNAVPPVLEFVGH